MRWTRPVIAGGLAIVVCGAVAVALIPSMTPILQPQSAAKATPKPGPSYIAGSTVPALASINSVVKALPDTMSGLPTVTTAPSRPVKNCVTPVGTATKAYGGGNWKQPKGIVIEVSAYPAGMGYIAEDCSTATMNVRRGDVIAHVTTTRASADRNAIERALDSITGCADTTVTDDQSNRNPTMEGFTGWLRDEPVTFDGPTPKKVDDLVPQEVTVPETPTYPHSPDSLPAPPPKPPTVKAPGYPDLSAPVQVRQPDPVGPGCGWAFTGMTPPKENPSDWNKDIDKRKVAAKAQLKANVDAYTKQLDDYNQQVAQFNQLNPAWQAYAQQISQIADQWNQQGEGWRSYDDQVAAWQKAKADFDAFLASQQQAQAQYDQQMAACQAPPNPDQPFDPRNTTNPGDPFDPGSGASTPPAAPTQVSCPTRPPILDQQPPSLPPSPVPPTPR